MTTQEQIDWEEVWVVPRSRAEENAEAVEALLAAHDALVAVPDTVAELEETPERDTAIALVHGFGQSPESFDDVVDILHNEHGFDVIVPRLPTDQYGTTTLDDAHAIVSALQGKKTVVGWGHSQGFKSLYMAAGLKEAKGDYSLRSIGAIASAPGPEILGPPPAGGAVPERNHPDFTFQTSDTPRGIIRYVGEHMTELLSDSDFDQMREDIVLKKQISQLRQAVSETGNREALELLDRKLIEYDLRRKVLAYERVGAMMLNGCGWDDLYRTFMTMRQHRRGGDEPVVEHHPTRAKRFFIQCQKDNLITPHYQAYAARQLGAFLYSMASCHFPQVEAPEQLVELILLSNAADLGLLEAPSETRQKPLPQSCDDK